MAFASRVSLALALTLTGCGGPNADPTGVAQSVRPPAEQVQAVAAGVLADFPTDPNAAWDAFQRRLFALQLPPDADVTTLGFEREAQTAEGLDHGARIEPGSEFARNLMDFLSEIARSLEDADRVFPMTVGKDSRFVQLDEFQDCVGIGNGHSVCCTGTLVAPNVVLTAGHCIDEGSCVSAGQPIQVFIGRDTGQRAGRKREGHWVGVKQVVPAGNRPAEYLPHPDYVADLLVLILEQDQSIAWRPMATVDQVTAAKAVTIVGFGANSFEGIGGEGRKRAVYVPVIASNCGAADAGLGCHEGRELVASRRPKSPEEGAGACKGDSGGPAYIDLGEGRYVLGAVTSRETEEDPLGVKCGYGTVCVRVPEFAAWVKTVRGGSW